MSGCKASSDLWKKFFEILGIYINLSEAGIIAQLQRSLLIMSYRISNLGLEKEITDRFSDATNAQFPFIEQCRLITLYMEKGEGKLASGESRAILDDASESLYNCLQTIEWTRQQRLDHGTSLAHTFVLLRL